MKKLFSKIFDKEVVEVRKISGTPTIDQRDRAFDEMVARQRVNLI